MSIFMTGGGVHSLIINNKRIASVALNGKEIYKSKKGILDLLLKNTFINNNVIDYSKPSTVDEGLIPLEDNFGTSYVFRGDCKNNYFKFANFWWRIIRVNGNGSIRLIYDGTQAHENSDTSLDKLIDSSSGKSYASNSNDNTYVGFMYGTAGSSTYEATHRNTNKSTALNFLETWYKNSLLEYEKYLDRNVGFYNNRIAYSTLSGGSTDGVGIGKKKSYYLSYINLNAKSRGTLKVFRENDLFTVKEANCGNKALDYPIGLVTADEVSIAGAIMVPSTSFPTNSKNYLYCSANSWTMTPGEYDSYSFMLVNYKGYLRIMSTSAGCGLKPVVNIKGDLDFEGDGTINNPYKIKNVN